MIQVNLIPDVKAEFLKAQRTKRFVISISFLVCVVFIGLVVVMFLYANVWQQEHTKNLSEDIQKLSSEYQGAEDTAKIITIQKQLQALPGLHSEKPLISRLVTYLAVVTPADVVEFRALEMDFATGQINISGSADTVTDVNVFANSLKNAEYVIGEDEETKYKPFDNVILDTISSTEDGAIFEVVLTFDPAIFINHDDINLYVPKIDSTSSEVERPKNAQPFDDAKDEE